MHTRFVYALMRINPLMVNVIPKLEVGFSFVSLNKLLQNRQ